MIPVDTLAVLGRPGPSTHGTGRTCSHDGCSTILSRYNPSQHCEIHQPPKDFLVYHGVSLTQCPNCGDIRTRRTGIGPSSLCRRCYELEQAKSAQKGRKVVGCTKGPRDVGSARGHGPSTEVVMDSSTSAPRSKRR